MTPTAGRLTRHTTNTVCEGAFARGYVVDSFTERPRAHITIGRTLPATVDTLLTHTSREGPRGMGYGGV